MKEIYITIKEWITSPNVLSLFTQYYQWITMFTSSLVADLIINSGKAVRKNKDNVREEGDGGALKAGKKSWLIRILTSSGLYDTVAVPPLKYRSVYPSQ